ncbi:MAG TPA: DUF402 domain-containing protein [Ktedonobacteraceae bacterium]|nr:DUF402 domain-containing protein [Ktedonobacteraceae bacterium]
MITVVKLDAQGQVLIRYQGEATARTEQGIVIQARWTLPTRDLGYTSFEPDDRFTEYFYSDRWFNIFAITRPDGVRKGWYCNVAEPARILEHQIEQVDLLLDLWVAPDGQTLILDEDEFAAAPLSEYQRSGAEQGLRTLLHLVETRQEMFSVILPHI